MNKSPIAVSCPQARRTANRRSKLKRWWDDPRWRELVKRETDGKECEECGKKTGDIRTNAKGKSHIIRLTLDHPDRWAYASFDLYIAANTPKRVVCTDCNHMFEKGMMICPVCREHYCHWRSEMCRACYMREHPGLKEALERAKDQSRDARNARARARTAKLQREKHPCKKRGLNQKCTRKSGLVCTFSAAKAVGCLFFREKTPKVSGGVATIRRDYI